MLTAPAEDWALATDPTVRAGVQVKHISYIKGSCCSSGARTFVHSGMLQFTIRGQNQVHGFEALNNSANSPRCAVLFVSD